MEALTSLFDRMNCFAKNSQTIIYARMSSDAQSSLADQIELCKEYAKRRKLDEDLQIFTDIGSGMDVSKLKSHSIMVNEVAVTTRPNLIVNDMSRLGRCFDIFQMVEFMIMKGVKIHSVQDNLIVEKENPLSLIKAYSLICSAIEFSSILSKKIKTSLAMKKKRGVFTGRKVPYGFKLKIVKNLGVAERFLEKDPMTFGTAKKLAKSTKRKNVKRPEGMSLAGLRQHRLKFRSYVKMTIKSAGLVDE